MIEKFLLGNYSNRRDEYIESLKIIQKDLQMIIQGMELIINTDHLPSSDEYRKLLNELEWHINRFSTSEFVSLKNSARFKNNHRFIDVSEGIGHNLESALNRINQLKQDPVSSPEFPERNRLEELNNDINSLILMIKKRYGRIRLGIQSFFIIPIVLSYFLGVYYKTAEGFRPIYTDIPYPDKIQGGTLDDGGVLHPDTSFENRYWDLYSDYFFGVSNVWIDQEYNKASELEAKFVLSNKKVKNSVLVYNIEANVEFQNVEIPWKKLNVTPDISIVFSRDEQLNHRVLLDNQTGPPAQDFKFYLSDQSKYIFYADTIPSFKRERIPILIESIFDDQEYMHVILRSDTSFWPIYAKLDQDPILKEEVTIEKDTFFYRQDMRDEFPTMKDTLISMQLEGEYELRLAPVYYIIQTRVYDRKEELYFDYNGSWYEIIAKAAQLNKFTETYFLDSVILSYECRSLDNQFFQYEESFPDFQPRLFYDFQPNFLFERPRYPSMFPESFPQEYNVISEGRSIIDNMVSMASMFLPQPDFITSATDPEGVDLIKSQFNIQLDATNTGRENKNLDVILNPKGYVISYVRVKGIQANGIYDLNLLINEREVGNIQIHHIANPILRGDWINSYSQRDSILRANFEYE